MVPNLLKTSSVLQVLDHFENLENQIWQLLCYFQNFNVYLIDASIKRQIGYKGPAMLLWRCRIQAQNEQAQAEW